MRKSMHFCALFIVAIICLNLRASAQDTASLYSKFISFPDKMFGAFDKKARQAESKLNSQTDKYLNRLAKQEGRIKRKLLRKDPQLANSVFSNIDSQYRALKEPATSYSQFSNVYSGHIDSLSTAMRFFQSNPAYDLTNKPEIKKVLQRYDGLQQKFNQTDLIRKRLEQRRQLLKEQSG